MEKRIPEIRSPSYIPYRFIGVGADRLDYTKGIPEKFRAIDRFLEKHPEYQNKFVYVEACAPSRTIIPAYMKISDEIKKLVEEINWKYQRGYWKPIRYIEGKLEYEELLALYRSADICIISSLQDGMNIVAKECVAANCDFKGALVLSQFAGATEELKDAIIVNPYDIEEFSDGIKKALSMPREERRKRVENMRKTVAKNNIYKWMVDFITEATSEE